MTLIKWLCDLGHQSSFGMGTSPVPQDYKNWHKKKKKKKSSTGSVLAQTTTVEYFCFLLINLKQFKGPVCPGRAGTARTPAPMPCDGTAWQRGGSCCVSVPGRGEAGGFASHPEERMCEQIQTGIPKALQRVWGGIRHRGMLQARKIGGKTQSPPSPEELETIKDEQPAWLQFPGRNIDLQLGLSILTARLEHVLQDKAL